MASLAVDPHVPDLVRAMVDALDAPVRIDAYSRAMYASDASMYAITPLGVAFPRDEAEVAQAVDACRILGVPIVPRGAGTSLAGQAVGAGLVLDLSRHLSSIGPIHPGQTEVSVGPGVVQDALNTAAAPHGLVFGPNTSTSNRATLGGMIGNNSSGSYSPVYGATIDHIAELRVVLSDGHTVTLGPCSDTEIDARARRDGLEGQIYRHLPRIVDAHASALQALAGRIQVGRHSGGYRLDSVLPSPSWNPARLLAGSEGTLGLVTEATVRLVEKSKATASLLGTFVSLEAALEASVLATAEAAASVEIMDGAILALAADSIVHRDVVREVIGDAAAIVPVTAFGADAAEAFACLDRIERAWRRLPGLKSVVHVEGRNAAGLARLRSASLGLLMSASTGSMRPLAFIEDSAVAPERLPEYVAGVQQILTHHGLTAGFYGHASVGCLHIRPFLDLRDERGADVMTSVSDEVLRLVAGFDGLISSEHGDGLARGELNRRFFGDELYEAFRSVKALFDPGGMLNPGKVVDVAPRDSELRDRVMSRPSGPIDVLHIATDDRSFFDVADRCMRIGACRKSDGTMCPSYQATRDEEHSTRGRANALVHALASPDPATALGDDRLHETLDLCLECKACKTECPLGVDMTRLKAEVLHRSHLAHGVPVRSRLFGSIRGVNRLGSMTAPVTNAVLRAGPLRRLLQRMVGIHADRPMPRYERLTVGRWHRKRRRSSVGRRPIVWLADCFTSFSETSVSRAAIQLLEHAGYDVIVEDGVCCGRAQVSKGMLDEAAATASRLVERLAPRVRSGARIVGCEPSCVLTLRDEVPGLVGRSQEGQDVAAAAALVEDVLVEAIDAGRLTIPIVGDLVPSRVLFHGHCHQKALVGTDSTEAFLRRIPGAEVEVTKAGCCGMAGSFGYEAEHYDLSMQIGELSLFPAVRAAPTDTQIAATGTSCRQQIAHGTGRQARHPVEIMWSAIEEAKTRG